MVLETLKALADPSRLRLVNILGHGEFTVQELTSILAMGQSRISWHLKIMTDAGVLALKKQGTWSYYRLADAPFFAAVRPLLERFLAPEEHREDLDRLAAVLDARRRRSQEFFERHARQWDHLVREVLPTADYRQALLEAIPACERLLEVGVGTGNLLAALSRKGREVIGVDHSPAMLDQARSRLAIDALPGIDLRLGEMTHLPLPDASVAAALINMVLHHAAQPALVLGEAARVLTAGGTLVIADLLRHDREWVRERMADQWLGFEREEIASWLAAAGFSLQTFDKLVGRDGALDVFICTARKADESNQPKGAATA
jgi:ubiquinone/menaquinone biosynthesis C-methylase UbiE